MFQNKVTVEQMKDTASAAVLILLLIDQFLVDDKLGIITIVVLVVSMIWPRSFKTLAFIWFGFSKLMGSILSKVLLSITYFILVTPVGLLRRLIGADSLKLKEWKKNQQSVFRNRDHLFSEKDLKNPF